MCKSVGMTTTREITGTTLAECEAQLQSGETIVHTVGSRVTGHVVCQVNVPEYVECDVCGYVMADANAQPADHCTNPVCGGGDAARARFAAAAERRQVEEAERARRLELMRQSFAKAF